MADHATIRALALHGALTTVSECYALEVAERYTRLLREYAETGDVAELHQEPEGRPDPASLEAIRAPG